VTSDAAVTRGASGARVAAQAKVNLRLRILARETSGYHQLETLFLRLALSDDIRITITTGPRSLDVDGDADLRQIGAVERNLAWRAAEAYAAATGWPAGFNIQLTKHIPIGAGLGGGSADAAAVLRALDAIAPTALGETALLAIAEGLGADVPFLTSTLPYALAWGRGERMLALAAPPEREVLLLLPPFSINTSSAYGWLAAALEGAVAPDVVLPIDATSLSDWDYIATLATNDFEPVVSARHPDISALVAQLRAARCSVAMMSGSGSAVFGVLPAVGGVEMPRFASSGTAPAPRVVLTRTAVRVEPVAVAD
jgi:4-diphosphocytidyl-2-C-methyl-D-erythritol kinase